MNELVGLGDNAGVAHDAGHSLQLLVRANPAEIINGGFGRVETGVGQSEEKATEAK